MNQETRFFCQCGRLLTAPPSETMVDCPTCRQKNTVPGQQTMSSVGSSTAVLAPGTGARIGQYILEDAIGQGGMGTVYRAVDQKTGQRVAVKLLHSFLQARPNFVSRFQREAKAASSLRHENIVRVLDFGIEDSVPYLAMELLEGADLMSQVRQNGVTEHQAIAWMMQAAAGLEAAAGRGITHRDIKPTNLVLVNSTLKIADFGLAKATDSDSHLTVTGEVLGTPNYMSPEQGRGGEVDFRSDLYSLGATVYHLLTGTPVFEAETPVAVIMKHLHEEPVPLRSYAPQVSEGLEKVIHGLLQKNPEHRYQSYASLIRDLKAVARGREPDQGAVPPARKVTDGDKTYILPAEQQTELLLKPAGFIRRTLAMTMDLIMIEVMLFLAHLMGSGFEGTYVLFDQGGWSSGTEGSLLLAILAVIATFAYFFASDAAGGRSFGKSRLRLRVCRLDGRDLGGLRSLLRTMIVVPGMLLFAPTLNWAAVTLLREAGTPISAQDQPQLWLFGGAYLLSLWVLGRLAGGGRPLHDVIAGARVYRAHSRKEAHRLVRPTRAPSAKMAAMLSLFPGVGLMYAGRIWLGLLFLVVIPMSWTTVNDSPGWPLGLWAASAFLAFLAAQRKARLARLSDQDPPLGPEVVRRQET